MPDKTYKEKLFDLNTFLFDVDGVFTDNRVLLYPGLEPVRVFNSRDAYAIQLAVREGFRIVIVSGGKSEGVAQSFARLGVKEVHLSVPNKLVKLDELISTTDLDLERTAYMGDDVPDLRVMQRVAFPCCPADAVEEIKALSVFISGKPGGGGCVRDLLEQAMKVQGKWLTENGHTW